MFMKNEIAGVNVTDEIVARYPEKSNRKEGEAAGIRLAKEVMKMVGRFCGRILLLIPVQQSLYAEGHHGKIKNCIDTD